MTLEGIVYDRAREFVGFVADPVAMEVEPEWRGRSVASFVAAAGHEYADAFQAPGARITIAFRGADEFSGWIVDNNADLVEPGANITYTCVGDDTLLDDVLAYPAPERPLVAASLSDLAQGVQTGPLGAAGTVEGQDGHYVWPAGTGDSVEGAIKEIIRANVVARLGMTHYVIAPNRGRGGQPVLPLLRFHTLREATDMLLAQAPSMSIRIRQAAMSEVIEIDVVEAEEWEQEISDTSGIIAAATGGIAGPTVTRTVAGGPGEMAARVFQATTEGAARTSQEQLWGRVIESFRDATGLQLKWPEGTEERYEVAKYYHLRVPAEAAMLRAYLNTEAAKDVTSGLASTGLEVDLTESDTFAYGGEDGIQLGTMLHLSIRGVQYRERVTGARINFTAAGGLIARPLLGARATDTDQELMDAVVAVQRALRRRSTQI